MTSTLPQAEPMLPAWPAPRRLARPPCLLELHLAAPAPNCVSGSRLVRGPPVSRVPGLRSSSRCRRRSPPAPGPPARPGCRQSAFARLRALRAAAPRPVGGRARGGGSTPSRAAGWQGRPAKVPTGPRRPCRGVCRVASPSSGRGRAPGSAPWGAGWGPGPPAVEAGAAQAPRPGCRGLEGGPNVPPDDNPGCRAGASPGSGGPGSSGRLGV